jgi:hypothetical protein
VQGLAWIIGSAVGIVLAARWLERRWRNINSFYEHDQHEPPVFDAGSWLGGNR